MTTPDIQTITYGDKATDAFGTSERDYMLWLDFVYDALGATLERRGRRYIVSAGLAIIVFLAGLLIALPFGLAQLYLTTPGVYYFVIGITWVLNSLRWLSLTYHIQTNVVRPCFPISDMEYKKIVSPYAYRATRNRIIVTRSLLIAAVFVIYFVIIYFGSDDVRSALLVGFPHSFGQRWHTGDVLVPKMLILDMFFLIASFGVYTGAHIMFMTLPLFSTLAKLPTIPLPSVVGELFTGALSLYSQGAIMWSFGIVLAEFIYSTQLDAVAIAFVVSVTAFGLLAYLWPRLAIRQTWIKSRALAIELALDDFYAAPKPRPLNSLVRVNKYLRSAALAEGSGLRGTQVLNLVVGQLLPVISLVLKPLLARYISL